ncbi:hypothetical protein ABZ816_16020 [Actinosynnema sp. NPDC047251]|uniref:Uncharacterized protein n=1 Tax=Saccharothrix espanaensis (strain ATCC 51144 / DSM 44229 / JCM 9112 / NBRC 15066 / NRRL 15764) TaxID=1179773 RepID=K0JXK3_SACES|nr:hypothetical protein [Saccharothrix espanaensis]CCH29469.1 hypothetical protein BN6_21470 [Saccharothrix espanaensis DSM 44229]
MPSFAFSVDDDPPHSGFSLGHLDVSGSDGTATTRGHVPDERLMVYLAAAQLLWDVRVLVDAGRGTRKFVGTDSSFTLVFSLKKAEVETRHGRQAIDVSTVDDFRAAVLDGARGLYELGSAEVEEDRKPLDDLAAAIAKYESWHRHPP